MNLHWNKLSRIDPKPGTLVTYADVCFWLRDYGKIVSVNGNNVRVQWSPTLTSDEWMENLLAWTEQPTDQRDTFNG
jgi:hypothetical protein